MHDDFPMIKLTQPVTHFFVVDANAYWQALFLKPVMVPVQTWVKVLVFSLI